MRRLAFLSILLLFPLCGFPAEDGLRLEGIAYTEGGAKAIEVQVWALGEQVREHPEWQVEPVFAGTVAPGKAFAVDLSEARLPVQVELAAEGHVAVALPVVITEQLKLPPAWLREGSPIRLRIVRPGSGKEKWVVWGDAWADGWGWDHRRWQVAIPHLEVPPSANLEAYLPPDARAVWVVGAGEGGAFGTVQGESPTTGGALVLKIDSAPIAVRVWDERKRPVPGVMLADASSPLETGAVTDDDGRAVAQLPMTGEWNLIATGPGAVALKAGRGRPQAEVDLDLKPRDDIELSWPKELGTVVLHVSTSSNRFGRAPVTFSGGVAVLPRTPSSVSIDFWGPGIAPGRMQLTDAAGRLPLKAAAAVRIEGRVVSEIDTPVAGLPVWVHISSSANARYQGYGSRGGPARLERPWLPWSVTDAAGRFSVAGLPPAEYEVEVRAPGLPTARSGRLEGAPGAVLETTVTLNAGATLALRIVDPEGNPLAGAVVDLHRSAGRSGGANRAFVVGRRGSDGDPEVTVFTDEEGRARLASAPVGAVRLRLIRPGSVSRTIDGIEVPPEGLDIGDQVLETGVTLTGTTVGPDGEPVGEAEVALERNPQTPFFQATTASDEGGRFSIHDLEPKGEVYLQARAEGLVPDAPLKVEMPTDGEIEVVMAEERFLEGLVLDARDDGPIEGAEVRLSITRTTSVPGLFAGRSSASVGESKTGTTGRFIFEGLSAGEFGLSVAAEGRRPVRQTVVIGESNPESVIIRMEPGLELRGRVETAGGEPAAGVSVFASTSSQSIDGRQAIGSSTQSAADGRFHFNDLSPGTQSVSARSEDGMNARATAEAGQPDEVVLRFPRGTVISGTVYGPDGSPFNGSTVRGFGSGASQRVADETGPDGRFELTDAGPGSWTIYAVAEGLARDSEEIEVHEGQPASVDLRLQRGAVVVGDIRGLSTSELESCMVWVEEGGRAGASADGAFRIDGVPSGEHQVVAIETVTRRTRSAGVVVPESGESERVVIDFAAGLAVFGQVLRGGAGAPGLAVSVHGVASSSSGETVSGPDGGWRIDGLAPGEYQIAVRSRSGDVIAGDHVLLETDTELDLHVPSGSLGGRVLEADTRRPIAGAAVTVVGSSIPPTRRGATSDDTGAFEIPELGDGEYNVRAEAPGRTPAQKPVTLSGSVAGEVELLLKSDAATVLVVRESDGSPATGIWILTLGGGSIGPAVSVSCTAGGRCAVDDLPQGRWTMLVRGQGMALVVVDVPKDEVVVQLRKKGGLTIKAPADESGAAWQVRVSDAATGIVLPVHPYSNPAGGEWVPVPISGLGVGVPEGRWRIESYAPDGTTSVTEVGVPGGGDVTVVLE